MLEYNYSFFWYLSSFKKKKNNQKHVEVVTLKNRGDRRTTGPLNVLGPVYKQRGLPLC